MRTVPAMFRSLGHRNYRYWAASDFVSVTGTWMQTLALNWLILRLTHSAGSVGLAVMLQSIPRIALGLWGGGLADRVRTRPLLAATQSAHAVLALVLAAAAFGMIGGIAPLYALALLSGTVAALDGPALGRFAAEIVGRAHLSNALALGSLISSGGRVLGMSLAGALLPVTGIGPLFLLNAVSFAGVLTTIAVVRRGELEPLEPSPPERRGVVAGLAYVGRTPWLLILFALAFVLSMLGRNYQVTMAAMSEGPLHAGAGAYGLLSVTFSLGTIAGGFVAAAAPRLTLRILLAAALATSVLEALAGVVPGLYGFAATMFCIAVGAVLIDTTVSTRAQSDTEPGMRGRVIATQGLVGAGAGGAGGAVLGWLCDALGPQATLVTGGVITTAATACAALALAYARRRHAAPAPVLTAEQA